MVQRIARRWFLLSVAGISLYIALYAAFFGFDDIHIACISAVLLSALGISIILALDDPHTQGNETAENIKDITFAGLAYILLVKRKPLLALLVISVVGVGLTTYYAFKSLGVTLETEGSALTIKLPGQTVY